MIVPQDFWSDLLYNAAPRLVAALEAYAASRHTGRDYAKHYRSCFDVSPIRVMLADISNAAYEAGQAVRGLKLDAAAVVVDGTLYTISAAGKISPCPLPNTYWEL